MRMARWIHLLGYRIAWGPEHVRGTTRIGFEVFDNLDREIGRGHIPLKGHAGQWAGPSVRVREAARAVIAKHEGWGPYASRVRSRAGYAFVVTYKKGKRGAHHSARLDASSAAGAARQFKQFYQGEGARIVRIERQRSHANSSRAGEVRLKWRRSGGGTGWYGYFPGDPERGYLLRRRQGRYWAVWHLGKMLGVYTTLTRAKQKALDHALRQP